MALPSAIIEVNDKASGTFVGTIRVRFARFPATFFRRTEFKSTNKPTASQMNERLAIADDHNGIIFLRGGRQIDVIRPPRRVTSLNATTDRSWAVEVDFEPALDGFFRITTAKQQVVPDEAIWDLLVTKAGLKAAIAEMRTAYDKDAARVKAQAEVEQKRASEEVQEKAQRFNTAKPAPLTPARRREADDNFEREVERRSREGHMDPALVRRQLAGEQTERPFVVEVENLPGAPFYRPVQRGAQKVLKLNTAHAFYVDVYAGPESSVRLRAAIELLLWALADAELDAIDDRRLFYQGERGLWSTHLETELNLLRTVNILEDSAS